MNSEDHTMCRHELIRGDLSHASRQHLATCPDCSRFAGSLDRALEDIRSLPPPMPAGLATRVIHGVEAERSKRLPTVRSTYRIRDRRSPRRLSTPAKIAAAVVGVALIALALVPLLGGTDARAALLQAARRTADRRTAAFVSQTRTQTSTGTGSAPSAPPSFSIDTRTQGSVAFGRTLHMKGAVTLQGQNPGVAVGDERFDVLAVPGRTYDLGSRGPVERTKAPPGGQVIGGPDTLIQMLTEGAQADITQLGEERLGGTLVHHYRFTLPPDVFLPPFQGANVSAWTGQAWIGVEDQTLRLFSAAADGQAGSPRINWETSVQGSVSALGSTFETPRGTVTSKGSLVLPRYPTPNLLRYAGQLVTGQSIEIQSVVSDEQLWIGSDEHNRVLVDIVVNGESPPRLRQGEVISFTGTMRAVPTDLRSAFSLRPAEGLKLLQEEGTYIEAPLSGLQVRST